MSKHTPEPWVATRQPNGSVWIHERGLMPHATVYGRADLSSGKIESDSARIVACVNACAGINPDAVPGLLAACKALIGFVGSVRPGGPVLAGEAEMVSDALIAIARAALIAIARAEGGRA